MVEALCVCLLTCCKSDSSETLCAEVLLPDIHVDCPNSSFPSDFCVLRLFTYFDKYIFSHYLSEIKDKRRAE